MKLKLFVWEEFSPDWSGGLAFAIAKDETAARKMIEEKVGYSPTDWGKLTIYPMNKPIAFAVCGGS